MLNKIKKIFTDSHKEALKAGMVEGERVSVMGGGGKTLARNPI